MFCLPCVNSNLDVFEHFLGFYEIPGIKSSNIVSIIKDIMIRMQLEFDKSLGQCHMIGEKIGVAQQIKEIQPKAHYTHCHEFSVSLSVKCVT